MMSAALELYTQLTEAPDDKTRARLIADAFDANPAWTVLATVGGAAIGTQVARNTQTGQCAYYQGDNQFGQPVYSTGPC